MTGKVPNGFGFEPPGLPDPNVTRTLIQQAIAYEVRGRVSAVAGESVEIEGMTAPIGSICELQSQDGEISRARVIGFRGVRPILAPLERPQRSVCWRLGSFGGYHPEVESGAFTLRSRDRCFWTTCRWQTVAKRFNDGRCRVRTA